MNSHFGKDGAYNCDICKKTTRDTGRGEKGLNLCAKCLFECELENAEADYGEGSVEANAAFKRLAELITASQKK